MRYSNRKSILKLCALALIINVLFSACANTKVDIPTTESVTKAEAAVDSTLANLNVEYSQSVSNIYSVDGIDFVATTNGIGIVEPGKEMRMLNNQKTAPRLMIIDNVIYYTVVNNVYETMSEGVDGDPLSILFAQCDCWSMNLDGTNQKKLFSYFGNGWVVFRQDNTVFYIDETTFDEFQTEKAAILKLCKIDLTTGESETITYLPNDGAGNTLWGMMETDYYTIYKDGYIIITSRSQEVGSYIYNTETATLSEQFVCTLTLGNDGTLYAIDYVEVYDDYDGSYTYSQHLVKYNIKNNSTEPTGIKFGEQINGGISGAAYGDNGIILGNDTLFIYTPGSGLIKASDTCQNYIYDVWVNTDKSYSYISSIYDNTDESTEYYLTNHVNPETAETVEIKEIKGTGAPDGLWYNEINVGANVVIGYCSKVNNSEPRPENIFCTDYTIVYK